MSERRFNRGDDVPHWILNVTPQERVRSVTFGTDVIVTACRDGVTVEPVRPLADGEHLCVIDGDAPLRTRGAPTAWLGYACTKVPGDEHKQRGSV